MTKNRTGGFTPLDLKGLTGFTLLELVLTALILSILIGVSLPLFRRQFSDLELRNSCYNIAKLISYVQRRSIAEGDYFRLNFDFGENEYWLESGESIEEFEPVKTKYGRLRKMPGSVEIRGERRSFIFYPNGSNEKLEILVVGSRSAFRLTSEGRFGGVKVERIKVR